jgi:CDP-diacylglycerol--glycerol-3-phosphate 3-phosphatidyltransferase
MPFAISKPSPPQFFASSDRGIPMTASKQLTTATWITLSRMLAIPLVLYWLSGDPTASQRWWAFGAFAIAAGTDWLDGYVARRFNQVSDLGKLLDPLVDKLLTIAALLCLIELEIFAAWGVFLIVAREIAITAWRSSQTSVSGANIWGKLKTVSQMAAIGLAIAPLSEPWPLVAQWAFWLAVVLSVVSGVIYVWPSARDTGC